MWYKRFGYKPPAGSAAGGAPIVAIAVVMIIISAVFCGLAKSYYPLILTLPLTIYFFHIAEGYALLASERIRSKRQAYHSANAIEYYKLNKNSEALESIRRAKIYGNLAPELVLIEEGIAR